MFIFTDTERVTDLGKLNLIMVVLFKAFANYTLLPQLPLKMTLNLKVVKIDSKIINSLHYSKFVTHTVVKMSILPPDVQQ